MTTKERKKLRQYTTDEVKQHSSKDDCWVIISGGVYNLSKWIQFHPGGELPIRYMAGHDCTDVFKAFHPAWVTEKKQPAFKIGEVKGEGDEVKKTKLSEDFEKMRQKVVDDGGLETNYWFYARLAAALSLVLCAIIYCVVYSQSVPIQIFGGVLVAVFWQQMAFIGHDASHHAITHNGTWDDRIGLVVGNLLTGVSIGWWQKIHNAHHIVTNSIEFDPDIQFLPFLVISEKYFKSIYSFYHQRVMQYDKLAKFLVTYQHHLYFLVMGLARFNLYLQSFLFALSKEKVKMRFLELLTMFLFLAWYLYLCSYLPTWTTRLVFVFLAHFLAGIIHIQITLSHFSMETHSGIPQESFKNDKFLLSQMDTTMDIECNPWMDFFHGGLQFQFEHHMFPRVARHNLRGIHNEMKALCKKHGLPFRSKSFIEANMEVIGKLKETSIKSESFSHMLWEGINAIG